MLKQVVILFLRYLFFLLGRLPRETITAYAVKTLERIREAGFKPGLCANKNWLTNHIEAGKIPEDVTVWLAAYNSK